MDTIDSGGTEPISLTHSGHLLDVLNEDSGNIAGFRFSDDRDLSAVPHSSQSLATPGAAGVSAQIGFSPDGRLLTVTERCFQGYPLAPFGLIDTFPMGWDGRPGRSSATKRSTRGAVSAPTARSRPVELSRSVAARAGSSSPATASTRS